MAQVSGYSCDRPGCTTLELGAAGPPEGWLKLTVEAKVLTETSFARGESAKNRHETLHLCSNVCLALLAVERANVLEDKQWELKNKKGASSNQGRGAHVLQHVQKNRVNPDCKFCQEETA